MGPVSHIHSGCTYSSCIVAKTPKLNLRGYLLVDAAVSAIALICPLPNAHSRPILSVRPLRHLMPGEHAYGGSLMQLSVLRDPRRGSSQTAEAG